MRSFPDLSGNIHFSRSHGIVIGQLARFAKACDHFPRFKEKAQALTTRLVRQGFDKEKLARKSEALFGKRQDLMRKYGQTKDSFAKSCF